MLQVFPHFNLFLTMIKYSIIICSYNRFELLISTVESILSVLKERLDLEILIIDNNSTDQTPCLEKKYRSNKLIKYFRENEQGLSNARNRGLKEATGEILIYLDDDIELVDNYFEICDQAFSNPLISISGGKVLPYKINIPKWLPLKYYYLVSVFDLGDSPKTVKYLMGGNFSIRRIAALQIGLYNINLGRYAKSLSGGEEIEFQNRATELGYKIYYNPNQNILHKINDKLNKKYVLAYSEELGKSEKIIDKSYSQIKVIKKYIKSYISIIAYPLLFELITDPKKKFYLRIIRQYGKGYIKSV